MEEVYERPNGRRGVRIVFPEGEGRAKQQFADACDINSIVKDYRKTGALRHFNKFSPQYGDVPVADYHAALSQIREVEGMFAELPSDLRQRFHEDPAEFLSFVNDPANDQELATLGLREAKPGVEANKVAEPETPEARKAQPTSPQGASVPPESVTPPPSTAPAPA